jgi:hypothetical protein
MKAKHDKPLGLDMCPDEALARFIGVKPGELPEAVRQRKGRPEPPQDADEEAPEGADDDPAS